MTDLLLDSQTVLWAMLTPSRLGENVRSAIGDRRNRCVISVVTPWEFAIKRSIGKLHLDIPVGQLVTSLHNSLQAELLLVEFNHVLAVETLPMLHRDPFDRLLVAQALVEGLTLVTTDRQVRQYDVPTLW